MSNKVSQNLEHAWITSVAVLHPFLDALGCGDAARAATGLTGTNGIDSTVPVHLSPYWGVSQREIGPKQNALNRPGELAAMQQFCNAVQRDMLKECLPSDVVESIAIETVPITAVQYFTYGEAVVEAGSNGSEKDISLTIRSYLDSPDISPADAMPTCASGYWIKFKKPSAISLLCNPGDLTAAQDIDRAFEQKISGKKIMESVMARILEWLPPHVLDRYEQLGCKLNFGNDIQYEQASSWLLDSTWKVDSGGEGNSCEIRLPIFQDPSINAEDQVCPAAFGGDFFVKVPSPAWLVEYISAKSISG